MLISNEIEMKQCSMLGYTYYLIAYHYISEILELDHVVLLDDHNHTASAIANTVIICKTSI